MVSGNRGLLADPRVDHDGDRSVIGEGDLHHGPEAAAPHLLVQAPGEKLAEVSVEWFGMFWWGGSDKGGSITFFRAGMQGELAHHYRFASGVEEGSIHTAFPVFEKAHAGDLGCEPFDIRFPVDSFDSKEDKET